jgi:molybdate transport system substrate-binding protein
MFHRLREGGDGTRVSRSPGLPGSRRVRVLAGAGAVAVLVALAACSSSSSSTSAGAPGAPAASGASASGAPSSAKPSGTLVVFAATSLTDAFNKIASQFEAANPGVSVKFNFNGSSSLATQITQGAPADAFASASPANMKTITSQGLAAGTPKDFARNQAEIMVEKGNPSHVTALADLANPAVKVVTCAPEVPCGVLATEVFKNAGVTVKPVSLEENVGGVVTKVSLGEADAGIVYVTDVKANEAKTTGVPIPADQNDTTDYPIAQVKGAPNATASAAFISYVLGPQGQQVLKSFGFMPPAT